MNTLQSLVLGVVEGFTEFLPISSTAHLIIASRFLGVIQSDYTKTFEIAIQSGAILAVLVLYFRRFLDVEVLKRIIVAFIPTGVLGLLFYSFIKDNLFGSMSVVLWALGLGGFFLILFEYLFKNDREGGDDLRTLNFKTLLGIGLFQSLAIVPGVSRSAATIVGGMLLGLKRATIVEFSFLLAVPTMVAATGFDLFKNFHEFSSSQALLLFIGFATSFITALLGIRFLLAYVRRHTFTSFGIYRILLVILLIFLGFTR